MASTEGRETIDALSSEFDYFDQPTLQTAIENEYDHYLGPLATLQAGAPIEFLYKGIPRTFVDLNNSKLEIKCKLTLENGHDLTANDHVGPVNLLLHSLFKTVDMELCDTQVTEPGQLYPYRAYLETLNNYDELVLKTRMYNEGWKKDTAGEVDDTDPAGANTGLGDRAARFPLSRVVTLIGRPHLDLFHQDKDIPANCNIKLRLLPNSNPWLLKTAAPNQNAQVNYKVEITSARLYLRLKTVSPSLAVQLNDMLLEKNYRIDYTKVSMKQLHIPAGANNLTFGNVFTGQIPDRVIACLVQDNALAGSYVLNPFHFQHFDMSQIVFKVNGQQIPAIALEPNFTSGDYIREYHYCLESLGYDTGPQMIDLNPTEWATGYTFFVFKLTPGPIGQVRSLSASGAASLEIKFRTPTTQNLSVLLLSQQAAVLEIDKFGHVINS